MGLMSKSVTYAGLAYLVFALIAMMFWLKGVVRLRAGNGGFSQVR